MKKVYVTLTEVRPRPGCERCPEGTQGGMARCYVLAADTAAAERAVHAKLVAERFEVVEQEWCVSFEGTAWESPESEDAARCAREAATSREVVLGRLDFWSEDNG